MRRQEECARELHFEAGDIADVGNVTLVKHEKVRNFVAVHPCQITLICLAVKGADIDYIYRDVSAADNIECGFHF